MCTTCGCGRSDDGAHRHEHAHDLDHHHPDPPHEHAQIDRQTRLIQLEQDVLAQNDRAAARNRAYLAARGVLTLNLMSAPGSGKTSLLERTLRDLAGEAPMAVIEGDQATRRDADRIRATGCRALQINTGTGCHLEAESLAEAIAELAPEPDSLLFIENVGNLVCPALFDLGERTRVVLASVTEGDDKPEKYPYMFHDAHVCVLNKIDLLPHVPFDPARFRAEALRLNPKLRIFELSALRGDGLEAWYAWLREARAQTLRGSSSRPSPG